MNQDKQPEIYEEKRPWGNFRRFSQNTASTVKIITVSEGQSLSLQTHEKRSEFWKIIGGSGRVEIDGDIKDASKGNEFFIDIGATHRAIASSSEPLEIMEVAFGEFYEEDIHRIEDKYGRA